MPWQNVAAPAQSWTTTVNSAQTWSDNGILPSAESRLNRVFPQSAVTQEDLSFTWRWSSDAPFFFATGNGVFYRSGITEPL